jgi:CDP-glycerol glycerophosphotransferase (TagB/SpsB family)
MFIRIFKNLKIILSYLVTFVVGFFFPKDKSITICASSKGRFYNGNSRALFEYMLSKNERVYFFVSSKDLYQELIERQIKNVIYQYSLEGFWIFIRARSICVTHGYADLLGFMPSPLQNWIYLAHGIGTKALGFLKEKVTIKDWFEINICRSFYTTMTSDFDRYMFISKNLRNPKKVFVTGFPRNDILYENRNMRRKGGKRILYAPTYRKGGVTGLFPFPDFKSEFIEPHLNSLDIELYLRFHPNNYKDSKKKVSRILESSKRIKDKSPDIILDVQDILPEVDILVTDFSSISRDFLFLDRPMIFIMNGLEELGSLVLPIRKEFAFCGYQVYTYEEFINALKEILEGKDKYVDVRRFVRDLSYNHFDNKSSKRVYDLIKELA